MFNNKVLYDGREIDVTNNIVHLENNCVSIIIDNRCVASVCYGPADPLSEHYQFDETAVYNIRLNKLWVESGYRHCHYARDIIYYVLSLYDKLDMVTLSAKADIGLNVIKGQEPLSQKELENFYKRFTYGSDSKNHIKI